MIATLRAADRAALADAGHLMHDFNVEYDEPSGGPDHFASRFAELVESGDITVLLARTPDSGVPVGLAVMRLQPSLYSRHAEAYLAELYVVPDRRGQGFGRQLITEAMRVAREHDADYMFLLTSEEDQLAQRLYEAAGLRRTEGEGGPPIIGYEREL